MAKTSVATAEVVKEEEKKKRSPRNGESIAIGGLRLPLKDRIELVKRLQESIKMEVEEMQKSAQQALELFKGLGQ